MIGVSGEHGVRVPWRVHVAWQPVGDVTGTQPRPALLYVRVTSPRTHKRPCYAPPAHVCTSHSHPLCTSHPHPHAFGFTTYLFLHVLPPVSRSLVPAALLSHAVCQRLHCPMPYAAVPCPSTSIVPSCILRSLVPCCMLPHAQCNPSGLSVEGCCVLMVCSSYKVWVTFVLKTKSVPKMKTAR